MGRMLVKVLMDVMIYSSGLSREVDVGYVTAVFPKRQNLPAHIIHRYYAVICKCAPIRSSEMQNTPLP